MLTKIDYFLDRTTMYKLVLYYLILLLGIAVVLGFFGVLPYPASTIVITTVILVVASWITNKIFSTFFEAPANTESVYITALILALIITPVQSIHGVVFLGWAAVLAMASKYILAIGKKHIFNPAAIAIAITAFAINQSASWWVGTAVMAPFVLLGGILIVRKIQHTSMVFSFFIVALTAAVFFIIISGDSVFITFPKVLFDSSLFFLAFVMLTEPLTTPPTKNLQILYGSFIGLLFAPQMHIGNIYSTPELALIIGNIFSYLVSPKQKFILRLKEKIHVSDDIIDFIFFPDKKLAFIPGQYMEWTLSHKHVDSRGNRRFLTIASSPTENTLHLGVKFYPDGSSFKKSLLTINEQTPIVAGQLAGDFTLPTDSIKKCVFIAGGIGITPFRSMIKYLIDINQSRPIVLLYANKTSSEIAYKDVFDQAQTLLGIKTVYTLTDQANIPQNWSGRLGRIDEQMIREEIPDYQQRFFYLSGPHTMVTAFENTLINMGIKQNKIKKDFFPGYV